MTNEIVKIEKQMEVPPLRKRYPDGRLYSRRDDVEYELACLYELPIEQVAERAEITDSRDPLFVSTESILHFVRKSKDNGDSTPFETLFRVLRQRLLQSQRVHSTRLGDSGITEDPYQSEVRDRVLNKFMEMLCTDRIQYLERLDYFERNFNDGVHKLRLTAKRDTSKRKKREKSESTLTHEDQSEGDDDFDAVLQDLNEPTEKSDPVYRFEVLSAISDLPDDERRVIELLIHGYMLKEVAEIVNCTEKTARTRRNRARVRLAEALEREDSV